jgi:hypothetical protein
MFSSYDHGKENQACSGFTRSLQIFQGLRRFILWNIFRHSFSDHFTLLAYTECPKVCNQWQFHLDALRIFPAALPYRDGQ